MNKGELDAAGSQPGAAGGAGVGRAHWFRGTKGIPIFDVPAEKTEMQGCQAPESLSKEEGNDLKRWDVAIQDARRAIQLKEEGNALFRAKDYLGALSKYEQGLESDAHDKALRSNR